MKKDRINLAARMTPEARKEYNTRIAKMPRTAKRYFCGATSMINAANRYFDCCLRAGVITLSLERKGSYMKNLTSLVREPNDSE